MGSTKSHDKDGILVKRKSKTDSKFGCFPEERSTETLINYGIININKVRGPTSHQVSAYVKQILGIKKTGHSGTLDPKVTGVLPVALGRATRIAHELLKSGKEYVTLMHLHQPVEETKLRKVLSSFIGEITQLPPVKSAVKREKRQRNIYYLEVIEVKEQDVLFRVGCEAGTYIRKLCHDIGQNLGCGAHMAELVRTKASHFDESTSISLNELSDAVHYYRNEGNETYLRHIIMPVEKCIEHLPKVWILDSAIEPLCHGTNLAIPGISMCSAKIQREDEIAVMSLKNELVAIGTSIMSSPEIMKKDSGIAVRINKVFMIPGTYPRIEKENKDMLDDER